MRKRISNILLLTAVAVIFIISVTSLPSARDNEYQISNPVPDTQFIIGAYHDGIDISYNNIRNELKLNTWHHYTADSGWGWPNVPGDYYWNPNINEYGTGIMNRIDSNHLFGMRTFMDRPIIEYLVGGQRIDYQCERLGYSYEENPYWFYSYHNSVRESNNSNYTISDVPDNIQGNQETVKYCNLVNSGTIESDILIDDSLKANREMSFNAVNNWMKDSTYEWYVLPRIKIDPSFTVGTSNDSVPVCKIKIFGWYGNLEKEFILTVANFKDGNNNYDGRYLQSFNLRGYDTTDYLEIERSLMHNFADTNSKNFIFNWEHGYKCYCDIKIYWTGACDMWIDRMRIENRPAHEFLTTNDIRWTTKLNYEIDWAKRNNNMSSLIPNYFYFEEAAFSHFPCIAEINRRVRNGTGNANEMIIWLNYDLFNVHMPNYAQHWMNAEQLNFYLNQEFGLNTVVMGAYALEGWPEGEGASYHPNTLTTAEYNVDSMRLSHPETPRNYDYSLQNKLDYKIGGTGLIYVYDRMSRLAATGMNVICCPQAHGWWGRYHRLKEPSNEELELQACLALSYNANGIMYFCYNSFDNVQDSSFGRGIMNSNGSPRTYSANAQNKFTGIRDIDIKLNKWGPYIIKFDKKNTQTCIYRIDTSRTNFLSKTYFDDIVSYRYGTGMPPCVSDGPGVPDPPYMIYDCIYERYIQATTFKMSDNDVNRYFVILNRRCSPFIDESSEDNRGGKRKIKIKFDADSPEFAGSNNWVITDLETGNDVITFDKSISTLIDLGDFYPAQGKLYKMSPVRVKGGTLVADETISGNVTCNGKIYNNGYNITINEGAVITFSDTAGIEMNGGTLTCGVNADNVDAVTLQKSTNGSGWNGLVLNNCQNVGIYNTNFSGIKANDTAKAVLISNCGNVYFRKSNFTPSNNSGAIQTVYTNPSFDSLSFRVQECNFYMGQSGYSGISIISNASMTVPIVIEWCTFNTSNDTSNAILMNNITGGAIKNNTITNFSKSIIASSSVIDIYRNTIIGNSGSYGLRCLAGSDLKLKTVSGYYLGGENYIRNYGTSSSCIYSDNSTFDINNGENHFDLSDTVDSKFLTGTLGGVPSDNVDAAKNCFHLDSVNNIEANHTMTWYGTSDPVSFTFIAYNCELTQPQDYMVFNYGGYNDTVYYNPGGEGSGFNPEKATNVQEGSYRSLRDTINLNLRKRNYAIVEDKAKQLLTQYPDSLESIGMVQKLYIASLTLDQNGNKIGQLKTYLENLISSNSQNPGLTKRAFYHIQKCKVKLGQYQSALDGFQYIMTQNPYSYEGLVASWDYAATYLLMGQGGSLSGDTEKMTEELNTPADTLLNRMSRNDSKTKSGSDGQKTKIFYEKVKTAAKDDRTRQEEKVKQLEKTIETSKSDVSKTKAKTELATMKTIKESVKIRKPNSVRTHITIVNSDIKKIFGIGKSTSSNTKNNLIPTSFELHQNYPNPFNPSTKIAFDLPKDAKVKLVIYDILGREIKTLIHNEFRAAGKYITEFNGSNLASGVYFYRLQANDYVSVKKMVMIK